MKANRAYRLIVRRGGLAPALLAAPDRLDHIEVVEVHTGEVALARSPCSGTSIRAAPPGWREP